MRYLHSMLRVRELEASLRFFCQGLGLEELRRRDSERGRYTLIFLATPADRARMQADEALPAPLLELTYNWDPEPPSEARNFGHLAYAVSDLYACCQRLEALGYPILRPPRDGRMAFVRSPDGISIELLQEGEALPAAEPWASRENQGQW